MGIDVTLVDYALAGLTTAWLTSQVQAYALAARLPVLRDLADERLVRKLRKFVDWCGHTEYTTHGERYRPARPERPALATA